MKNAGIIYEGKSLVDGKPIVVILSGKLNRSNNTKTGDMLQTNIIRQDIAPTVASKIGEDYSICKSCIHRGFVDLNSKKGTAEGRSCYVNLLFLNNIYRAYKRGKYSHLTKEDLRIMLFGESLRIGSYGDPGAVPSEVWLNLIYNYEIKNHTGYSHQILDDNNKIINENKYLADFCMVSCDNIKQAKVAWSNNLRTYRTITSYDQIDWSYEIVCPESYLKSVNCKSCGLCRGSKGSKAKSIAIPIIERTKKNYLNNINNLASQGA